MDGESGALQAHIMHDNISVALPVIAHLPYRAMHLACLRCVTQSQIESRSPPLSRVMVFSVTQVGECMIGKVLYMK